MQPAVFTAAVLFFAGAGPALHGQAADVEPGARPSTISAEEAVAIAVNDLRSEPWGFELRHPAHRVRFDRTGLTVEPTRGGPRWRWELAAIAAGELTVDVGPVDPCDSGGPRAVAYERGAVIEQYLILAGGLEQRFLIDAPPAPGAGDLVIDGRVECAGTLETLPRGWQWRAAGGVVSLGRVRVFDACGQELPATMTVGPERTRIRVDGAALAGASYPVIVDPEIGTNDLRLSAAGPDGDETFDGLRPAVAFNPAADEYLVVWEGDEEGAEGEFEIYGQLVDALSGLEVGANDFRISDMGPDGDSAFDAERPDVVYSAATNRYLVVWAGDDGVSDEFEIYGQLVDAATGLEVGADDFRISHMGPDGNASFDAQRPAAAWNGAGLEYLIVWEADDDAGGVVEGEFEIFGRRLDAAGSPLGAGHFRISDAGPDGEGIFDAEQPAVAWNATDGEYLVVWEADDDAGGLAEGELEIYGQRLDATGAEVGVNDFRISDMGPDGVGTFDGERPDVAWSSVHDLYLVVWEGDDDAGELVDGESEIFGQLIDGATGGPLGANDFRISSMGPNGDTSYDAQRASVSYDAPGDAFLVVWQSDHDSGDLVNNELEIFGQLVDPASGRPLGDAMRYSDMGLDGDADLDAGNPRVCAGSAGFLVVWEGDDGSGAMIDDEQEIYGQFVDAAGEESGLDLRLSDMGRDGDLLYDARKPAVAWNSTDNEYLVVWEADGDAGGLVAGEFEIFGQIVDGVTGEERGNEDFRISDMGPDGAPAFDAEQPAVAYNAIAHEYLVVWVGDDNAGGLAENELEVYGQRLSAATGGSLGENDFRISDVGPDGVSAHDADHPDVAWNGLDNEYLVVWEGDEVNGEFEIHGQRLTAAGVAIGLNDFRISDMGTDGESAFDAEFPKVAWNGLQNEYFVVWCADDDQGALVEGELEIYGQRLSAAGVELGVNDRRLSDMGPDGDGTFDAERPDVVFNAIAGEYLVVWQGDDDAGDLVNGELEIFGQRLDGATGVPLGDNDFRISHAGPDGDTLYDARGPAVAWDSASGGYFVVWEADHDAPGLVEDETEIFGQRLDGSGQPVGPPGVRLSDMGPDGDASFDATNAAVAWNGTSMEYLVAWQGDDGPPLADEELEVYVQRFTAELACPADTDGDGVVDVNDLVNVILAWDTADPATDVNGDGIVDVADLIEVVLAWGEC